MPERLLTVTEAAETLQVGQKLIRGWLRSGELRGCNVAGSPQASRQSIRIRESDLDAFLAARSCLPDEKPVRRKRRNTGDVIKFF
jgi:excisionase family DNA binding protein